MAFNRALIVVLFGLIVAGSTGMILAGDWEKGPIEDLDGLQDAHTDLKKPSMMELGRSGGVNGHPEAYGELEVTCQGHQGSGDRYCNIQLDILFSRPRNSRERVEIRVFDGDAKALKTVYLQRRTNDNTMARVYVVGVPCVEGLNPVVRVGIKGDGSPIEGHARVTFMKALCEKEDKTNWQVASNHPMYDADGRRLDRPNFLFQGN